MTFAANASDSPGITLLHAPALAAQGLCLRAEQDADLPWLRDLYASTRRDELAGVPWQEAAKRAFLDQQFALQRAHYLNHFPDAEFLIVQTLHERIGRFYLHRAPVHHLLVDISLFPAWRGKGAGTGLIVHAQTLARAAGCDLALHVSHANPAAHRLYARLGFVAGDTSATHLAMRWQPADAPPTSVS
ncbi:GNAT family N-acetyltransferase [Xanthomonas hortorum]|uniref:GNAT family N-acetyltransferase n=1 Tax=Xanthomonas hortorum pv. pelargonii TaxID=453602 RepID=A0A6V7F979_9XANT|nr:GNAT family N-acetyltransferase [Xanthomonas hortorum]MCE4355006.1 GNAT family N-acetyltransferase [Xanthomonas hortorum pv. pelargonii]MCM5522946.1 GNAT family N-acetyltransferase [Xanthomonas hortorum pv. pelargonii]MCM5535161.1 GNAT family N-acetyltransferase [Xanthomonas hortorum pv. pelargonii]MCM5539290.1 GNAT family N-acetyltransferase [Xanthomonas hortorum pv. pelargonii]MCM5543440.1 GNAT family N-acetyltransferase [Xanthomonas hortorum pv. pelargonii]